MTDQTGSGTQRPASPTDLEAVDQLIRLTEMASDPLYPPGERRNLQDQLNLWAAHSPAHLRSFLEKVAIFEALGSCETEMIQEYVAHIQSTLNLESLTPASNGLAVVTSSLPPKRGPAWPWAKLALAAAAVVAAIGMSVLVRSTAVAGTTYHTQAGEQQRVPLEDGSLVYLNERSEIRVSFSDTGRSVSLLHGQALFDVTRDTHRPFVVVSSTAEIWALGTRFDVSQHSGATRVAVVDGSVRVTTLPATSLASFSSTRDGGEGQPLTLTKYEVAEVTGQEIAKREKADIEKIVAWQSAQLTVDHERLDTIAGEFNLHNRRQLRITDPVAARREVSGSYKTDHPEKLLGVLQQLYPDLAVQENEDGWIVNTVTR